MDWQLVRTMEFSCLKHLWGLVAIFAFSVPRQGELGKEQWMVARYSLFPSSTIPFTDLSTFLLKIFLPSLSPVLTLYKLESFSWKDGIPGLGCRDGKGNLRRGISLNFASLCPLLAFRVSGLFTVLITFCFFPVLKFFLSLWLRQKQLPRSSALFHSKCCLGNH